MTHTQSKTRDQIEVQRSEYLFHSQGQMYVFSRVPFLPRCWLQEISQVSTYAFHSSLKTPTLFVRYTARFPIPVRFVAAVTMN